MAFQEDAFQTNAFQIQQFRISVSITFPGAGTIARTAEINTKYSQDATIHSAPTLTVITR